MEVAVDYGDGKKRPCQVYHTLVYVNGKPKEIYRSNIHTNPVTGKPCYVVFDPSTGEVKVVEVK